MYMSADLADDRPVRARTNPSRRMWKKLIKAVEHPEICLLLDDLKKNRNEGVDVKAYPFLTPAFMGGANTHLHNHHFPWKFEVLYKKLPWKDQMLRLVEVFVK